MIALVLAAGYATRLYPLTKGFPKPLLEVQGKPVLSWLLDDLETIPGIDGYVIVSNHVFLPFFQEWSREHPLRRKVTILDDGSTENENRLGAVKDILFSIDSLGLDDDLLVLAGDNVLEFSLKSFVDYFHQKKASCILRFEERDPERLRRTGVAEIDAEGSVLRMEEKPQDLGGAALLLFHAGRRRPSVRGNRTGMQDRCTGLLGQLGMWPLSCLGHADAGSPF